MSSLNPLDMPTGYPCSASFSSFPAIRRRLSSMSFTITGALVVEPAAMMHGVSLSCAVASSPSSAFGSSWSFFSISSTSTMFVAILRLRTCDEPLSDAFTCLNFTPRCLNKPSCSAAWWVSRLCNDTFSTRNLAFGLFSMAWFIMLAAALSNSPSLPSIPVALSLALLNPLHGVADSSRSYLPLDFVLAILSKSWLACFTLAHRPSATCLVSPSISHAIHLSMFHPRSCSIRAGDEDPDAKSSTFNPGALILLRIVFAVSRSIAMPLPDLVLFISSLSLPWSIFIFILL